MLWIVRKPHKAVGCGAGESFAGRLVVRTSTLVLPLGVRETRIGWMSQPVTPLLTNAMGIVHMAAQSLKTTCWKDLGEWHVTAEVPVPVPVGMTRMKEGSIPLTPKDCMVSGSQTTGHSSFWVPPWRNPREKENGRLLACPLSLSFKNQENSIFLVTVLLLQGRLEGGEWWLRHSWGEHAVWCFS